MVAPSSSPKPFLDSTGPIAFAHRGAHDGVEVIENTMSAFEAAVALGFRYVETDVHATVDGFLVAFHDERLDRVTDRRGLIRELPWREVERARVGDRDRVPLLEEVLGNWPELHVNIDPKHDNAVEPLVRAVERTKAVDRICVGSFSDRRVARVRMALGPRVCTAMGPMGVARLRAASFGLPVGRFRADCAQVPPSSGRITIVDERFVQAAHVHRVAVHVWTVDIEDEMNRLLDLGVDGLMTDRAGALRRVLLERGQWA